MPVLEPPEKHAKHSAFSNLIHIFFSAIGSFLFLTLLLIGAMTHHVRDVVSGREKQNAPNKENSVPNYTVREPYPDMKNLKVTKDLRYYALQLGLDLEEYKIETEDGYILTLHRLINPNLTEDERNNTTPCLLQHGLLLCSGAWLVPGKNSLPYYFIEQGYDVWLGNNRCGFEPEHSTYKGNLMHNEEFWDWDIRAFASYDLPCIIDNVLLRKPLHEKLVLVGHLQGCTQTFLMFRNKNLAHVHKKVDKFFALAPAVFPGSMFHDRSFIKFIHNRSPRAYAAIFGTCCFMKMLGTTRQLIGTTKLFEVLSYQMFKYLFGWGLNNCHHDKKIIRLQFLFNVTFISLKLMSWWLSYLVKEGFSNQLQPKDAYADGTNHSFTPVNTNTETSFAEKHDLEKNAEAAEEYSDSQTFFPYKTNWFDFNEPEQLVPIVLFVAGQDFLVDGERLATHMTHYEREYYKEGENLKVVRIPEFNHLDVIWSLNVIGQIGMVIEEEINAVS